MKDSLIIYYNTEKNGNLKAMIDKLTDIKDFKYFKRSRSEIAKLILTSALKKELKKYEVDDKYN